MTAPQRHLPRVKPSYLITAAASFMAAIALTHASVLVWLLLAALAVTPAYMLGRRNAQEAAQKPARKPPTEFAKRKRAASTAGALPRGARPPASPGLIPMMISEYCSDGRCGICPGNGCECTCMHDPAIIVARNAAEYDRAKS